MTCTTPARIVITCQLCGSSLACDFEIAVVDCDKNVVGRVLCAAGQKAGFAVPCEGQYRVTATVCANDGSISPGALSTWLTVSQGSVLSKTLVFGAVAHTPCPKTVPVEFLLTDAHYKNLPIEKGALFLWPNML